MQTECVRTPIDNGCRSKPFARAACTGLLALSFLGAMSASALTRIEPTPIGIPGSGTALGSAVALVGDTAAVSAPAAQPPPAIGSGSVDIYRHVGAVWLPEAVLLPTDPFPEMGFGTQISLGADLLVVASANAVNRPPAVYTFSRTGSVWQQVDRFDASTTVSLSGNTLALGNGSILVRAGLGWSQQAQLVADGTESFNSTVIDGDVVLAHTSAFVNEFEVHNFAYVFHRTSDTWVREARIELGDSSAFDVAQSAFAVSAETALIAWRNVVTAYARGTDGSWSTEGVLDPLTSAPGFGSSLALDGDRALVASPLDTVYGWPGAGTVYVFERSSGSWIRTDHVAHSTVNYYNYEFGSSLALDGETMLVGAPGASTDAGPTGDATILTDNGSGWEAVAVLDAGNDHRAEGFGGAVGLSGPTLLVGAPNAATSVPGAPGAAYVFEVANGDWIERARLLPSTPYGYRFGAAVAIDQDTAVVSVGQVPGPDLDVSESVYVFVRGDGTWPQQALLTDGNSGSQPSTFGAAVAVQSDQLAVGQTGTTINPIRGAVHVFGRSGNAWSAQGVVQAADGSVADGFGSALALVGTTLVVGAPGADVGIETDAGAVYVFTNTAGVWSQQAEITAPIAAKLAGFGRSVALSGTTLAVGAVDTGSTRGAAYVYTLSGGVWTLQDRLLPAGSISGSYGTSVAISGSADRIVVGQPVGPFDDPNGRAFVFAHTGSGWSPLSPLAGTTAPPASFGGDVFGRSLAMSGETVAIGSPRDGRSGAAYVADVGEVIFDNGFEGD